MKIKQKFVVFTAIVRIKATFSIKRNEMCYFLVNVPSALRIMNNELITAGIKF